ncbi:GntR family transcriptional regulator [Streptomyces sp. NPDC127084]|uniref:GntR family transcriptional regulator n=1 Tax=Streptomyces sp. NPDC127084 TaxID=3347133 RepID=UPI00364C95B0
MQDGQLAPGAKLPSARDVQAQYGIANSTAQNALRVLKEEGPIYFVQDRGVFVRQLSPRAQFLKRYHEGLEEATAQYRADEDAHRQVKHFVWDGLTEAWRQQGPDTPLITQW